MSREQGTRPFGMPRLLGEGGGWGMGDSGCGRLCLHGPVQHTLQLRERCWGRGMRDVKCVTVPMKAPSNTVFYRSSQSGHILATPRWWEQSGLQGLPFSF